MADTKNPVLVRVVIILLLVLAVIGSYTGHVDKGLDFLGLGILAQANDDYLVSSFNRSLQTFGVLSAVKVGLAIIEGTEVGVGFGVQVGDAVQAPYDYVDIAWRTVLASTTILLSTRYILRTADLIGHWFLLCTFLFVLFLMLANWYASASSQLRRVLRDVCLLLTVITIAIYLILPLSIAGGSVLSKYITSPSIEEAEQGLSSVKDDLALVQEKEDESLWSKITSTTEKVTKIVEYLTHKANELSVWVLKLIAGYLFDTIIFPLGLFIFLVWFTKIIARYVFDLRRSQTLREDLEAIARKYYGKNSSISN